MQSNARDERFPDCFLARKKDKRNLRFGCGVEALRHGLAAINNEPGGPAPGRYRWNLPPTLENVSRGRFWGWFRVGSRSVLVPEAWCWIIPFMKPSWPCPMCCFWVCRGQARAKDRFCSACWIPEKHQMPDVYR
jgi:hypothetical protein